MSGPQPDQSPDQSPGERRLARPPSDRYGPTGTAGTAGPGDADDGPNARPDSLGRGIALGLAVAVAGAIAIVVLGGALSISAGLLVVAGLAGWGVAAVIRSAAGQGSSSVTRVGWAVGLAVASVGVGQFGLWRFAASEGGVLGLTDYLAQTFGILVPLEIGLAAVVAWWSAR